MMSKTLLAHPIITGSVFPVRANTKQPAIRDLSGGVYRLLSESGETPSGLLARILTMTIATRMIEEHSMTVRWDNLNRLFDDMNTRVSGSSIRTFHRNLELFNTMICSTPKGNWELHADSSGRELSFSASPLFLEIMQSQGVEVDKHTVQLLRGTGVGGVPIDMYVWLVSISEMPGFERIFPWAELETMSALTGNSNFPLYFTKSLYEVSDVFHGIHADPLEDGLHVRVS